MIQSGEHLSRVFKIWYNAVIDETVIEYSMQRESIWTESLTVGDYKWIKDLKVIFGISSLKISRLTDTLGLQEQHASYGLMGNSRHKESFWK